ncbi:MAG: hypothetical protein ACP5I4_02850 [Oceanipulchritudo sp.]
MSKKLHLNALAGLLACWLAGSLSPASASEVTVERTDPGPFYGFWEFQEPAGDTCVVIIKRGGRISRFWAGTASRAIQKGSWERTETGLTARWEGDTVDVFRMLGDNAIERNSFGRDSSLPGEPDLTIRGVRVDSRIPGSLTVQQEGDRPAAEDTPVPRAAPAIPVNNAYVGYWKIRQSKGLFGMGRNEPHFFLQLSRSGEAACALRDWEGNKGLRGKWVIDGDRAIITWPNKRRDVLYPNTGVGYTLATYRPKDELDDKPQHRAVAVKVPAPEGQQYFVAGEFKRLTVLDIRGTWVPAESGEKREYISIEGWGNAYRYPATDGGGGTDPGKWRLLDDRLVITWVDGSKDVIRVAYPTFIQESYSPEEPLTGKPDRSIEVIRSAEEQ